MDDFRAGAELCEREGLLGSAELLRSVVDGSAIVYAIRPGEWLTTHREAGGDFDDDARAASDRVLRVAFLDREAATRHALRLGGRVLASGAVASLYAYGEHLVGLPEESFCRQAASVLGVAFRLSDWPRPARALAAASPDQLRRLAALLPRPVFEVVPIPIVAEPGGAPSRSGAI